VLTHATGSIVIGVAADVVVTAYGAAAEDVGADVDAGGAVIGDAGGAVAAAADVEEDNFHGRTARRLGTMLRAVVGLRSPGLPRFAS